MDVDRRDPAAVGERSASTTARPIVPPAPVTTATLPLQGRNGSCVEDALLPNRPRERKVHDGDEQQVHRQAATTRKRTRRVRPTARPTSRPASTAPQRLPTPPRTMIRNAGTTASTPTCGRTPQIGAITTPAIAARPTPRANTKQAQPRQVDAERAHHLAVVRAGLDHRAVRRLLEEEPEQADHQAARSRRRRSGSATRSGRRAGTRREIASAPRSCFSAEPQTRADRLLDHQRRAEGEEEAVERILAVGAAHAELEQHAEHAHHHRREQQGARSSACRAAGRRTPPAARGTSRSAA